MARRGRPLARGAGSAVRAAVVAAALLLSATPPSSALAPPSFATVRRNRSPSKFDPARRQLRRRPPPLPARASDAADAPPETAPAPSDPREKHGHVLAILAVPRSASARIANEAILETAISVTSDKLSVVLRSSPPGDAQGASDVTLTELRRYAGEVYSMAWDAALGLDERENSRSLANKSGEDILAGPIATGGKLLDLVVYPQGLPNSPPEGWIDLRPDLSCAVGHDSVAGWITSSDGAGGSGRRYAEGRGEGAGGLREHVAAVNAERKVKGLEPLEAVHVDDWPDGADAYDDPHVVFLEDEDAYDRVRGGGGGGAKRRAADDAQGGGSPGRLTGAPALPPSSLYSSVCVGGTFDGMHYGHRKLLTLAVSSVQPVTGRLLIGVTKDEMLTHKAFAECIPPLEARVRGVLDFVSALAPGMTNRVRCVPIDDEYGPPGKTGKENDFDALVLSHETLPTGRKLNDHREKALGLDPLTLLCTQRTEPHGMSSTALRRMRSGR